MRRSGSSTQPGPAVTTLYRRLGPRSVASYSRASKVPTDLGPQPLSEAHGVDGARWHHPIEARVALAPSAEELAARVRAAGQELGFVRVGFAAVEPLELDAE